MTYGKVMVVEAQQQVGPHQVKGCLQLDDLAQFVPDPMQFLQNYGFSLEDKPDGQCLRNGQSSHRSPASTENQETQDTETSEADSAHAEISADSPPESHAEKGHGIRDRRRFTTRARYRRHCCDVAGRGSDAQEEAGLKRYKSQQPHPKTLPMRAAFQETDRPPRRSTRD